MGQITKYKNMDRDTNGSEIAQIVRAFSHSFTAGKWTDGSDRAFATRPVKSMDGNAGLLRQPRKQWLRLIGHTVRSSGHLRRTEKNKSE